MKILINFILVFIFTFTFALKAEPNFFEEAKKFYKDEDYEKSKFLFQRNIVFNPKDYKSYFYLAKIFQIEENNEELEKNLNTSLLIEPNNEEAAYMLINIELDRSNFSKVRDLKKNFKIICSKLCSKIKLIDERLKDFKEKNES